jgi:excisionase family DNA binding protein
MNRPDIEQSLTPEEAAKFLDISIQKLARMRREGRVEATRVGKTNVYVYTVAALRKADLSLKKRGPKPKQDRHDSEQNRKEAS